MKYKIGFLALVLINGSDALTDAQKEESLQWTIHTNTLKCRGKNAKICLKMLKQNIKLSDEEQFDVNLAIKLYLKSLSRYHVFIEAKDAATYKK